LPVDGAGVSAFGGPARVPLGASSPAAATAERLQFTVGEGPCLQALQDRTEIRVNASDIKRRWPAFHDELIRRTPYRSIASLPLQITTDLPGAIDLYFRDPTAACSVDLDVASHAAGYVADTLRATSTPVVPSIHTPGVLLPAWMYSANAVTRLRTWIATGVVMMNNELSPEDALVRIRAHAYAKQEDIADVTEAIISGALKLDDAD
jgi:hypothetical protein